MSITQIGDGQWDFIDHEGRETRLPPHAVADVSFPTTWRIFGPVGADNTTIEWARKENYMWFREAIPAADASVENLSDIPDSLEIGDESFKGRDRSMDGDTLPFSATFGGHEAGQQAYAIAEMEVAEETEVIFGAGCDWWMQWWIDGDPVYNTLEQGNRTGFPWPKGSQNSIIKRTDHCFRQTLSPGKHLIVVRTISGELSWVLRAGLASPREEFFYSLPYSNQWDFLPELDEIHPPSIRPAKEYWDHSMAIRTDLCMADETLECEYLQTDHSGHFGFIFGAQDNEHYYWAQIPKAGLLWRARAFYAAISIADGSGYYRNLKMELMPNVLPHTNIWRSLKVERRGNQIQMWVAGVKGPCVTDDTYGSGRIGIKGFAGYKIRNLKIDGRSADSKSWVTKDYRHQTWYNPIPDLSLGDYQHNHLLLRVSNDELIMPMTIGRDESSNHRFTPENSALYFFHSLDNGRSWSQYGAPVPQKGYASDKIPLGRWLPLKDGVLRTLRFEDKEKRFNYSESKDKGLTWSEWQPTKLLGNWARDIFRKGTWNKGSVAQRLADGTLIAVISHGYDDLYSGGQFASIANYGMGTWGTEIAQTYSSMSTDDGLTWSEPVPMDNAANDDGDEPDSPCFGFLETRMAELPGGKIVALARPYRSPFMWQTQSEDGGKSWQAATYAPFSGSGAASLLATHSGYLVSIKRGSGLELRYSVDGGVNWDQGTSIDLPNVYNGHAMEVEPDIILVGYPSCVDEVRPALMRMLRIKMTPDGPVPLDND